MGTLVTGSTGFIGRALVGRLRAQGEEVVALVRRPEIAPALEAAGARVVIGDVTRPDSLALAVRGVEAVVHCAGVPRPATLRVYRAVHIGGTSAMLEASRAAGVRRFVNIASQAVVFAGRDLLDVDETCETPKRFIDPYSETKAEAERIALGANQPGSFEVTSLRPPLVWGRGDTTILPIMARLATGRFGAPIIGKGDNIEATVHVENLLDAVDAAIAAPAAAGRAYFVVDGFSMTCRDFFTRQLGAIGAPARFMSLPRGPACAAAWALDGACGLVGATVPLAYFGARMAVTSRRYIGRRAHEELGYSARIGLEEGMADLGAWAREIGGAKALIELGRRR